jgi:hypothetical protein
MSGNATNQDLGTLARRKFRLFRVNYGPKGIGNEWDKNCQPQCSQKAQSRVQDASPQVLRPCVPFATKSYGRVVWQS